MFCRIGAVMWILVRPSPWGGLQERKKGWQQKPTCKYSQMRLPSLGSNAEFYLKRAFSAECPVQQACGRYRLGMKARYLVGMCYKFHPPESYGEARQELTEEAA